VQNCLSIDWFMFPFAAEHFGTLIAHLSFSLHFLRHHLDGEGYIERYAKQYMRMLRSLRIGGRLIYTPGLPFIEQLLPVNSYRVRRFSVNDIPRDVAASVRYARQLGEDPVYACHIQRI
jgi:hypothetical protein